MEDYRDQWRELEEEFAERKAIRDRLEREEFLAGERRMAVVFSVVTLAALLMVLVFAF